MLQPKDTNWLNGYKNKTHIHAVYKKPTSDLKKHIHWKWEDGKIYSMQMESKRKLEWQSSYQTKLKNITRDKKGHYIIIKGSIQEEDITIVNILAPNIGTPQYIWRTLIDINGEINSNTIIVRGFNTWLTPMDDHQNRKLIRKHKP